jgi:hypothetical protein
MTRVVAVICSYWESRLGNIETIIKDLKSGSVCPDHIIVLNNNKNVILKFDGVDVLNSEFNTRSRGKYPIALCDVADYYLFLDDDTSVGPETLEYFLSVANKNSCYAPYGRFIGTDECIFSDSISTAVSVDYVLAVGLFVSFNCITRMLLAENLVRVPTKWKHEAEDILIGITNKPIILPMNEKQRFVHLSWGTEAMDWGSDGLTSGGGNYYSMRYTFADEAKKILDENPLPEY